MSYEIKMNNRTCLIMGGSRGIGAECCRQLASAGANIAFGYYASEGEKARAEELVKQIEQYNVKVKGYALDVSEQEQVSEMVDRVIVEFGTVDVLIYCAGILIASPFGNMTYELWRKMMSVNLDGAFFTCKSVIPNMLQNNGGRIIFISTNTTINGGGSTVAYPASKAGLEGFAKQLLNEYLSKGINVNIISPAVIDTDLLRERYPTDEMIEEYGKKLPVKRTGKTEDVANAVVFLASDKSSYICGHNLLVDGGRTFYYKA